MPITQKVLVDPKLIEVAATTQYTAVSVIAMLDKFTAMNRSALAATINVYLVKSGDVASGENVIAARTLQPNETYLFPEIVGHVLGPGDFIRTEAGTVSAITIRVSGREITV